LRFAQRLFLSVGVAALAYAGGTAAYAGIYQRYQSWKFERARMSAIARNLKQEVAVPQIIKAAIVEEAVDLREGDVVGRLEVSRIGISVIVLQGIEEDTLIAGRGTYREPHCPAPKAMLQSQRTETRFSANCKEYGQATVFKSQPYAEPTSTLSTRRKLSIQKTLKLWSPEPVQNSR
jgi:hypothetical protein